MHERLPDRLPYDPAKFVNRQAALQQILALVRRIAAGLPVEKRVLFACGERGCGKTWFLRHLAWTLSEQGNAFSLYLNLPDEWVESLGSIPRTVERIAAAVRQAGSAASPLVLLVDGIDDLPADLAEQFGDMQTLSHWKELVAQLEENVLAPAAQNPRLLIVIAEQGGPRHWSAPEFREKSAQIELGPFEEPENNAAKDYVQEQIDRQLPHSSASLEEIKKWAGGYPWPTYLLARDLSRGGEALQGCALLLLGKEHEIRYPYLEALSILQAFDDVRIGELLIACFPGQTWDYPNCLKMRKGLLATTMVHWVKEKRGYVIDEPLRRLLEAALHLRDQGLWRELHCVAYRLYEQWAADFEQSREDWEEEQAYHENALRQDGHEPADCPPAGKRQQKEESHE